MFLFPVVLIGYEIAGRFHRRAVVAWLGLSFSCVLRLLETRVSCPAALLHSVQLLAGRAYQPAKLRRALDRASWLWTAISGNLAALCYFKYLFPHAELRKLDGGVVAPLDGCAAASGHFVLYLHADRIPGRSAAGHCDPAGLLQLPAFRHLLPAPDRRPHPAPQRHHAAVSAEPAVPSAAERPRRGRDLVHDGTDQEGAL